MTDDSKLAHVVAIVGTVAALVTAFTGLAVAILTAISMFITVVR